MKVEARIYASERIKLEDGAVSQLVDAASMPSVATALATPDIHVGYGVPIGCVMATREVVSPAAVGYDINCGMRLMTTPLDADEIDFAALASSVRRDVPLGEGKTNLKLQPRQLERVLEGGIDELCRLSGNLGRWGQIRSPDEDRADASRVEDGGVEPGRPDAVSVRAIERGVSQLGTLGGGNHFIEFQVVDHIGDEAAAQRLGVRAGQMVVMIHTGSRGFGHQVAGDYMKIAGKMHGKDSPSKNLAFLGADEDEGARYTAAMFAAANFAFANRQVIASFVRHALRREYGSELAIPLVYDVTHNMVKRETHHGEDLWVHRKGATRAFAADRMANTPFADVGQPVLIPGSMGTASYLLLAGDKADETLFSVNHGAGRVLSRSAAAGGRGRGRGKGGRKRRPGRVTMQMFDEAMKGIVLVAEDRHGALEEAPQAYKDIDEVIDVVVGAGLARVVARMRPRAVLKG
jgi:tRNA-splicing ligase RtcB